MRLRYPKITLLIIGFVAGGIVGAGLMLDYAERRTWPPSVSNPGRCIVVDSDGDTRARASQIVEAIEQFERVNKVPLGALRQLKYSYINKIPLPLSPVKLWTYTVEPGGHWTLSYRDPDNDMFWTTHWYSSKSRKWEVLQEQSTRAPVSWPAICEGTSIDDQ